MSSREAFEAWVDYNFPFKKDRFDLFRGEYKSQFTEQLWQSWQASREGLDAKLKSAENNDVDARCHVAELEAKCAALAAENSEMRSSIDATIGWQESTDPENVESVRMLLDIKTQATDAFLAEVRAHARNEGINYAASRLAAAFNHGFVDKPLAEVYDVVRMILTAKEDLANDPAADGLSGEYAEKSLIEFAAQLRQGAAL